MRKLRSEEREPATGFGTRSPAGARRTAMEVAPELPASRGHSVAPAVTAAAMYFLAAKLGEWLAFPSAPVSAFWAPNALLLAALALAPRERWPTYLLAVLPFHLAAQLPASPVPQVVIQYVLNCAESALGAWILLSFCPQARCFDRARGTLVFIAFGAILAPFLTSVLMAGAFSVLDLTDDFWLMVTTRTLTNAFAAVTLVPLIIHGAERIRGGPRAIAPARAAEAGVLALSLACVGFLVFVYPETTPRHGPVLLYAPLPFLVWAAMRFGPAGACGAALLLGGLSTWGVLGGRGPFAAHDPVVNALSVVTFQLVTASALLILSSLLEERKLTARSLSASEARIDTVERLHTAVLASLHAQIAILDSSGKVIEINDSWRRFLEAARPPRFDDVLVGQNLVAACAAAAQAGNPDAAEELEALRAVLGKSAECRQLELSETGAAGPRWFEVLIVQLRKYAGGAVVTRTDVTARKQAESEARNQRQQLTHLGRAAVLGELSGALAHELKQPLTSIMGNAEAGLRLMTRSTVDTAEIKAILHDIIRDDERASQVIQRLRDLLRGGETQRQPVSLNAVVQETIQLARSELITRNVRVITNLDARLPPVVADRVQMQQVVLNLLMNACEAMSGMPPADRSLALSTRFDSRNETVEVSIQDSGCGIASGDTERIFQPFVTTKSHGMGLGLAICRSVSEAHHGRLWAENAENGGAILHLSLPVDGGTSR